MEMEEDIKEGDPVPQITRCVAVSQKHLDIGSYSLVAEITFEEVMKYARRSVSDQDIQRYKMFSQVCNVYASADHN